MALPQLFGSKESVEAVSDQVFIAILLSESAIQSSLWSVSDGEISILERSNVHTYKDLQDCVIKTDKSLQELGKQSENVDKVVFGLEPTWADQHGVLDAKKPFLKKITEDLSLKAVGFVVTVEALVQEVAQTQPAQAVIFVDLGLSEVQVSVIKQGKLAGTKKVGRSGDISADLTEALARFSLDKGENAQPAKILLFSLLLSESEINEAEQAVINADWVAARILAQKPLVEVTPPEFLLDLITRQGGKAMTQANGLMAATPKTKASSFGIPIATKAVEAAAETAVPEAATKIPASADIPDEAPEFDDDETPPAPGLPSLIHQLRHPSHRKFLIGGFVAGVLILVLMFYGYLAITAQAKVAVTLKTDVIAQDIEVTLDPAATQADLNTLTLPASQTRVEMMGSDSTAATGTKLVGDPAKGKVTIQNKTTAEKSFAKGTQLKSGNLLFTLDADVKVASASVQTSNNTETKTFGQAEATITASQIGEESNLAAKSSFTIADFDSGTYAASNTDALVGGASREVRVVAESDRKSLENTLKTKLISEAEAKFKEQTTDGTFVAPTGRINVKQTEFSAKVGDEVNQLTLNMVADVEGLRYQMSDLQPLSEQVLASQVPSGFELMKDSLQLLSSPQAAASTSARVKLSANLNSKIRPAVTAETLKSEIAGRPVSQARNLLESKSEVETVTINFQPPLAGRILRGLPPANRLEVEIQ